MKQLLILGLDHEIYIVYDLLDLYEVNLSGYGGCGMGFLVHLLQLLVSIYCSGHFYMLI